MGIKTKFNIGDPVWFISGNMVSSSYIMEISVKISKVYTEINYITDSGLRFPEIKCFKTKEELIKSL